MLDRVVKYGEEYDYSHEELYTVLFALGPCIESIVRINRGQDWEPIDDWYIYDIYAKVALLCMPGKSKDFLSGKGMELEREITRIYEASQANKIHAFCKFMEEQLAKSVRGIYDMDFGKTITECLEHYARIASNSLQANSDQVSCLISCSHYILHFCLLHPKLWSNKPETLVAASVNSAMTFLGAGSWGSWYEVKYRTAVRQGILLDTDTIAIMNPGARVHIVQQFGRRVQVDQPFRGFCSLHDGAGLDILVPISEADLISQITGIQHDSLQSPFRDMTRWAFTNRTNSYIHLKRKFSQECHGSVATLKFQNGHLVQSDQSMSE
jgi:hypothetical protein